MQAQQIASQMAASADFIRAIGLQGPDGQVDRRRLKKLDEVAGFLEQILKVVRTTFRDRERIVFLECSCGKSYLGFALDYLLSADPARQDVFMGVDSNPALIERCRSIAGQLGLENMSFEACRSLDFQTETEVDFVIALHACDTATDEAIAKGIKLKSRQIMVVPCCQNQLRSQLKTGHPLTAVTDFGPLRYRLSNLVTDALRALFLKGAGYTVELQEIASPRVTPKNLMISARRLKRKTAPRFGDYLEVSRLFGVKHRLGDYCPELLAAAAAAGA